MIPSISALRAMIPATVALGLKDGDSFTDLSPTVYELTVDQTRYVCASTVRTSGGDSAQIGVTRASVAALGAHDAGPLTRPAALFAWVEPHHGLYLAVAVVDVEIAYRASREADSRGAAITCTEHKIYVRRDDFAAIANHPACVVATRWVADTAHPTYGPASSSPLAR